MAPADRVQLVADGSFGVRSRWYVGSGRRGVVVIPDRRNGVVDDRVARLLGLADVGDRAPIVVPRVPAIEREVIQTIGRAGDEHDRRGDPDSDPQSLDGGGLPSLERESDQPGEGKVEAG